MIPSVEVPQSDVVINTVFLNHQCDPIQLLCYLADHARQALFLWVLLDNRGNELSIRFGQVSGIHDLGAGKPLPLSFHNDVRISTSLLRNCLQQLGFGEIEFVEFPPVEDDLMPTSLRAFRMVWARRTEIRPSAYETVRRKMEAAEREEKRLRRSLDSAEREGEVLRRKLDSAEREAEGLRTSLDSAWRQSENLQDELAAIRNSYSYRIGRLATAPIRFVRNAVASIVKRGT